MKIEISTGARRRTTDGWRRVDRLYVNGKPVRGEIVVEGFRKHAHSTFTRFGAEERSGQQAYWLLLKNGLVKEERGEPAICQ